MGDEERMEMMNHYHHQNQQHSYQEKKLENWEEQNLSHEASIKQEISNNNGYMINKSCVTTTTIHNFNEDSNNSNINGLNFSEVGQYNLN